MAEITMIRDLTTRALISQKLVCATSAVRGSSLRSLTNGSFSYISAKTWLTCSGETGCSGLR